MAEPLSNSQEQSPTHDQEGQMLTEHIQDAPIDVATAHFLLNGTTSNKQATHHRIASGWLLAFTRIHKIPVFKRVWLYLFCMLVYTILVDLFMDRSMGHNVIKEAGAAGFTSVVLGLLLVFRTNTAYERWSEGRKLWGQLVNDSRNLAFKVRSFITVPELEKMRFGQLIISFSYALKHHLRNTSPSEPLPGLERSKHEIKHLPMHVTGRLFDHLHSWKQAGYVDMLTLVQFENQLKAFMDICGGCERIKNSPIAVSYRAFMRQGIIINLLIIPWFLGEYSLLWVLPLILMGTYFLVGLELIAEDVEEPFGSDGDDLPLDTICSTIRTSVTDILGLQRQLKYTITADTMHLHDPLKH